MKQKLVFISLYITYFRLQRLADALVERFVSKGLMKKEYDRVKLHATVMNTKLRSDSERQTPAKKSRSDLPPRFSKRMTFDARKTISVRFHGVFLSNV